MSIYSKVMVGFIALAALVFYYSAVRAMKERSKWWAEYNRQQLALEGVQKQIAEMEGAVAATDAQVKSVRQLRHELARLMVGRGRVWSGCSAAQPDPNTGEVRVTIPVQAAAGAEPAAEGGFPAEPPAEGAPAPAAPAGPAAPLELVENQVLYVFDERPLPEGGYLGEFRVASVAERQVALTPVGKLSPAEMERLTKAAGTWALHDVMPSDNPSIFAAATPELTEERLALLPESVRGLYKKDGQAAEPNDPPDRVVDGKYQRPITDFVASFHEFRRQRSLNADLIAADQKDKSYLEQALADSQTTVKYRDAEIKQVKAELAQLERERNAVVGHRKGLDAKLAKARKAVARLEEENRQLAERYVRWQSELAAELDAAAQAAAPTP